MIPTISEKTRIPVSLVIIIISLAFFVGIGWARLGELEAKEAQHTASDAEYLKVLHSMDVRLSNIEGRLAKE